MKMRVYSTGCPKCQVLVRKLNDKGVDYELIEDIDEVLAASNKYDIKEAPFVVIDEQPYGFADAIKFMR